MYIIISIIITLHDKVSFTQQWKKCSAKKVMSMDKKFQIDKKNNNINLPYGMSGLSCNLKEWKYFFFGKIVRQLQDKQTKENEMKEKQQIANKSGEKTFQSVVNTKINFISTKNNNWMRSTKGDEIKTFF